MHIVSHQRVRALARCIIGDVERFGSRRDAARFIELRLLVVAVECTALACASESFALVLRRLDLFDLVAQCGEPGSVACSAGFDGGFWPVVA